MSSRYGCLSRWRVEGICGEIADVLSDAPALARWWPSVYLSAEELQPSDVRGLGRRVRLRSKGWLPGTITWEFEIVESNYPYGFTLLASGDIDGRCVWLFEQDGSFVDITCKWRLSAARPLLCNLSFLLKPVFEANHRWAMAQGEQSLKLELARRRATSAAARAAIPSPPGPVTYAGAALVGGAVVVGTALAYLMIRSRSRNR